MLTPPNISPAVAKRKSSNEVVKFDEDDDDNDENDEEAEEVEEEEGEETNEDEDEAAAAAAAAAIKSEESSTAEPKPAHSYIGLIALAILSTPERRLVLSDIYQWILDNYNYFHNRGSGWRNSIRHNLSLNDCFMKAGRSANGKGHYWTIHPANLEDFLRGDFRRRRAQRRVRKSLGLTVPEEVNEFKSYIYIIINRVMQKSPYKSENLNY